LPNYLPEESSMAPPALSMSWPTPLTVWQPDRVHTHIKSTIAAAIFFFISFFLSINVNGFFDSSITSNENMLWCFLMDLIAECVPGLLLTGHELLNQWKHWNFSEGYNGGMILLKSPFSDISGVSWYIRRFLISLDAQSLHPRFKCLWIDA